MHEAEEDLGIIFAPSQNQLMLAKSISSKEGQSNSIDLESREIKSENKQELLKELRDFVVEANKIEVTYLNEPYEWGKKKIALESEHDLTAVRFEKKDIGEFFGM